MTMTFLFLTSKHDMGVSVDYLTDDGRFAEGDLEELGIWTAQLDSLPESLAWIFLPEIGMPVPVSMRVHHYDADGTGGRYERRDTEGFGIVLCPRLTYKRIVDSIERATADRRGVAEAAPVLWARAELLSPSHPFRWFAETDMPGVGDGGQAGGGKAKTKGTRGRKRGRGGDKAT
jgi:hypothetical protein